MSTESFTVVGFKTLTELQSFLKTEKRLADEMAVFYEKDPNSTSKEKKLKEKRKHQVYVVIVTINITGNKITDYSYEIYGKDKSFFNNFWDNVKDISSVFAPTDVNDTLEESLDYCLDYMKYASNFAKEM